MGSGPRDLHVSIVWPNSNSTESGTGVPSWDSGIIEHFDPPKHVLAPTVDDHSVTRFVGLEEKANARANFAWILAFANRGQGAIFATLDGHLLAMANRTLDHHQPPAKSSSKAGNPTSRLKRLRKNARRLSSRIALVENCC